MLPLRGFIKIWISQYYNNVIPTGLIRITTFGANCYSIWYNIYVCAYFSITRQTFYKSRERIQNRELKESMILELVKYKRRHYLIILYKFFQPLVSGIRNYNEKLPHWSFEVRTYHRFTVRQKQHKINKMNKK